MALALAVVERRFAVGFLAVVVFAAAFGLRPAGFVAAAFFALLAAGFADLVFERVPAVLALVAVLFFDLAGACLAAVLLAVVAVVLLLVDLAGVDFGLVAVAFFAAVFLTAGFDLDTVLLPPVLLALREGDLLVGLS